MPVKTVSWKQPSEPPSKRPTTSPLMSLMLLIPLDQTKTRMQSLSLTVRVPSLLMAQTMKHQNPRKREALPVNTPQPLQQPQPNSVFTPTALLLATESPPIKKTIIVTRRRRAKRTTWSPQLLVPVFMTKILEGTTVPQQAKALGLPHPAAPKLVTWTALMIMVRQYVTLSTFYK